MIQARMGSIRLPGKVLLDLAGEPVLVRVMNRVCRARTLDEVLVATTTESSDDAIVDLCARHGWPCFRGSEHDVLDRYYHASTAYQADAVVRITSDCPLIEPEIVDLVTRSFLEGQPQIEYASNTLPRRTFPRGLDAEVLRFDVLERAWRRADRPSWREHVTLYIWQNPGQFHLRGIMNEADYSHMRWTVDTPDDLEFVRRVYGHFGHDRFSWLQVLDLLEQRPEWLAINAHVEQKAV